MSIVDDLLTVARQYEIGVHSLTSEYLSCDCMASFGYLDWQIYVPEEIRCMWPRLSMEAKALAYAYASSDAYLSDPVD
jgi:hypothetical protein